MNKQLLFVKRPQGEADASTWSLVTNPIPEINEGEILVKQHYVSLDPAMRGWMKVNPILSPWPLVRLCGLDRLGK